MKIRSFGCTRYKAFKEPVSIEVRPLTLFIGKNNSGKSALLRLPRLLLRALSSRQGRGFPVAVDGLSFGGHFYELIHGGIRHGDAEFAMVLDDSAAHLDLRATVQNVFTSSPLPGQPTDTPVVSRFILKGESVALDWTWEPALSEVATYQGVGKVPFRGLLPHGLSLGLSRGVRNEIDTWQEKIAEFEGGLEHLGPLRKEIDRIVTAGLSVPLDFYGEGVFNQVAQNDALLNAVGEWYQKFMGGWRFDVERAFTEIKPVLKRGGTTVSLVDGGQGMQHILPVVVQQLRHQLEDRGPFLNLVEEPELHLHAAVHADLADLFLNTAKAGRGQVMVETHSENFLLRIRRRIAEGLSPDLVALYWVDDRPDGTSLVQQINIQQNGEVDWWPEGVFSEGYQEVRQLRRAGRSSRVETTP